MRFLFLFLIIFYSCSDEINKPYDSFEQNLFQVKSVIVEDVLNLTASITIKFNQKIATSSVYNNIVCISGKNQAYFYYSIKKEDSFDSVTISPQYRFIPFTKYNCVIKKELQNIYGVQLDEEYKFSFTTNDVLYNDDKIFSSNYTFTHIYNFIQNNCKYCHNTENHLNFDVSKNELYDLLINGKNNKFNLYYITPTNYKNSYLINKLIGINIEGNIMPSNNLLPLYQIEKIVGWIQNGGIYE